MRNSMSGLLALVLVTIGCGSDGPAGPTAPGGSMSARIDGQSWTASAGVFAIATQGAIAVSGGDGPRTISFAFLDQGTGTYTIGTDVGVNGSLTTLNAGWLAVGNQGSGSIVVTTRTANRVAGTFFFTLTPVPNTDASGERVITDGVFDVEL